MNISEGRPGPSLGRLAEVAGGPLVDVHSDLWHNRSVFTLAGPDEAVLSAARDVARSAVELFDLRSHRGEHPRFGVVDVVPFVALEGWPVRDVRSPPAGARAARSSFATWAASELGLPVFLYGPERSLPDIRRSAWSSLPPDLGPPSPPERAGSVAVGYRPLMVAYNLWLASPDLAAARAIARALRSPAVRALAFRLGDEVQVSCNLVRPFEVGPAEVMDAVSRATEVARAELVGLVPALVLEMTPSHRWAELDLSPARTIEARLRPELTGKWEAGPERK